MSQPETPEIPAQAAAERVGAFLEGWARLRDRTDLIYGLWVDPEADSSRDLLASDLRLLLAEREAVSQVLRGIDWKDEA